MLAVEQYIGTLLRSKDVSAVKDGLSNVLYWGCAQQPGRRDFRVSDFRKTIPDPEREPKLDQFAQLMRSGRARTRARCGRNRGPCSQARTVLAATIGRRG